MKELLLHFSEYTKKRFKELSPCEQETVGNYIFDICDLFDGEQFKVIGTALSGAVDVMQAEHGHEL